MSRILLAWELGFNLGHLARLRPVAEGLRSRGHVVMAAVRDVQSAAAVLGSAAIPFLQAPHAAQQRRLTHQACSYADVLLSQGWGERQALWGLIQGWLNLFALFRPDLVVIDHSPAALMATRLAGLRCVHIGNGFEMPPASSPLPPFPGLRWASAQRAAESEKTALNCANAVARAMRAEEFPSLSELLRARVRLLATFPELDHYGLPRRDGKYIGPLPILREGDRVDWPSGDGPRVFACLRPEMGNVDSILSGLAASGIRVVCVALGFRSDRLQTLAGAGLHIVTRIVDLAPLAADADAALTYGAEGTTTTFLLAGVPQLLVPGHMEAWLAASRIVRLGAGHMLERHPTPEAVRSALHRLIEDALPRMHAQSFAAKYRAFSATSALDLAIANIERALGNAEEATWGVDDNLGRALHVPVDSCWLS